jgi:hypothetical protein
MQNLRFNEHMTYNLLFCAVRNGENLLDNRFVPFILPHMLTFQFIILHDFDGDSFTSIAPWLSMRVGASG